MFATSIVHRQSTMNPPVDAVQGFFSNARIARPATPDGAPAHPGHDAAARRHARVHGRRD